MSTCDEQNEISPSPWLLWNLSQHLSLFFSFSPQPSTKKHLKKLRYSEVFFFFPASLEVYLRVFGFYLSWWHVASSTSPLALKQSLQAGGPK